jgi:hypothetical protein
VSPAAPLLIAYDAENRRSRSWVDWCQARDSEGLLIAFPFQNAELLKIAPELAGRPLHLQLHGLDTRTREVWAGAELLPQVWSRLPRWRWVIFLTKIKMITKIITIIKPIN